MTSESLDSLLTRFPCLTILVVGDFFLDRYLLIDPDIAETSLETGLQANQVVEIRNSPGAAGTVTNNLCALGIGRVIALGFIGEDGHGFSLEQGLQRTGVDITHLVRRADRQTPTYLKPLLTTTGEEQQRFDIKNRIPTSTDIEQDLVGRLEYLADEMDGIIVLDQVQESGCGVVTDRLRACIAEIAARKPNLPILGDSRKRIDDYRDIIIKPNEEEAQQAADTGTVGEAAEQLAERNQRPVLVTRGPEGILVADGAWSSIVPGIPVPPPIDIVGAGDSVSASVVSGLAAGASLKDAVRLGVIVSSITIQQIGTTGVATPDQIRARFIESPFAE